MPPLASMQPPGSYTVALTHEQKGAMWRSALVLAAALVLAGVVVGRMTK
jgi:hypothetical protein